MPAPSVVAVVVAVSLAFELLAPALAPPASIFCRPAPAAAPADIAASSALLALPIAPRNHERRGLARTPPEPPLPLASVRVLALALAPLLAPAPPRDFVRGTEPGILNIEGVVVGDAICFEVAYDDVFTSVIAGGAEVITVQTNNATYQGTGQPAQQWDIERPRALRLRMGTTRW